MTSLYLNSLLPLPPHPQKLLEPSSSSSLLSASNCNEVSLKPIVTNGDPPTFVSAPFRRIIAVGDLHGDLSKARDALQIAGVLSSDGRDQWIGEDTVLVQVGDILDRGDGEIAILSLLRLLDEQAKANGGAVFQVNGNHETMNIEGDFRYVDARAIDECTDFLDYLEDYAQDWDKAFKNWIFESRQWKEDRRSSQTYWDQWNVVKVSKILQDTLEAVGAKAMVVGHTPQLSGVNCEYGCGIWRVDVGMSSGVLDSRPEVLEIRGDKARVIRSNRDRLHELQVADYI